MNTAAALAVLILAPALVALAIRRLSGGVGIGLIDVVQVAVAPFLPTATQARAVPEPDFEPWRFDRQPARPHVVADSDGMRPADLPTAA